MRERLAEEWAVFLAALHFLTRFPVPANLDWTRGRIAAALRWHPGVGALVGAATGLIFWLAASSWDTALAALVATGFGIFMTGALHEDGLADACDGLGGGADRERALEIMRDSRIGTYGAIGLGLMLAVKVLALADIAALAPAALVGGHAASRASSILVIATSTYARDEGTAKPVADGIGSGGLVFALATALSAVLPLVIFAGVAAAGFALAGLALAHLLTRARFERRLGGYTGDCLGAVQQTSEIGFYLGLLAWL